MAQTIIKPRLFSYKSKMKIKPELNITKSTFSPNLQTFKQSYYQEMVFLIYKRALKIFNI